MRMGDIVTDKVKRKSIGQGVNFTVIQDKKFKQNQISVYFIMPLTKETASVNAMLPLLLKHGSREYPDMTALNRRLNELYGARLDVSTHKRGDYQVMALFCECLGDSYAFGGEKVLESCANLLKSIIFDPAFENGTFREKDVAIEKRNLIDQIDSVLNDKRQYALVKLKEAMCKDEAYGLFALGRREDVEKLTPDKLFEAWKTMLSSAAVEIFLVGPGNPEYVEKPFADAFSGIGRNNITSVAAADIKKPEKVNTVVERLPVTQAKLVMGLRTSVAAPDNTDALHLATVILGGSPHSKLFANVREKMSLCYYCLSYLEKQKGIMFIDSGIEESNYEKARGEILKQLDELKAGSFTDDEMKNAKLYLHNALTQVEDSLESLSGYYLSKSMSGDIRTPKETADDIMNVTREEVIEAANGVSLDTVYLLAGLKEGE